MKQRWALGFSIAELLVVVVVIAILATVTVVAYNGLTRAAVVSGAKAHLKDVASEMRLKIHDTTTYPTTLSAELATNSNVTVQIKSTGVEMRYSSLNPVQNGTLFSDICQRLIDNGVGKAQDQGGNVQDYITGCGNWNYNKVQIGGWENKIWNTPVSIQQLRDYGNSFTTNVTYHKAAHEATVKKFYNDLTDTFVRQGGTSPVTSFWDYWADSGNGGVMPQALPAGTARNFYCAEARSIKYTDIIWHVTETNAIAIGPC